VETTSTARSVFGLKKTGLLPKNAAMGLDVATIAFQSGIEELVHDVMKVPRVVKVVLRHPVISRFLRATPSALDFVTLYLTRRYVKARTKSDEPVHHLVILDMPAFGHARQMLAVGRVVKDLLRVGPIASRAGEIDQLIHDTERASVLVVTLPEEMPVTETLEGYQALHGVLGLPVGPIVVNCTQSNHLSRDEAQVIEGMASSAEASGDAESAHALRQAAERSRWAVERTARIEVLRRGVPGVPLIEVPLFAGATAGRTLITQVAAALQSEAQEGHRGAR
jgi:anion-transporting  ArsA/GET3 family ATPase